MWKFWTSSHVLRWTDASWCGSLHLLDGYETRGGFVERRVRSRRSVVVEESSQVFAGGVEEHTSGSVRACLMLLGLEVLRQGGRSCVDVFVWCVAGPDEQDVPARSLADQMGDRVMLAVVGYEFRKVGSVSAERPLNFRVSF